MIFCYQSKSKLLPGKSYTLVYKVARHIFNEIKHKTKRRTYIRSDYFGGQKIFLDYFWIHLNQKSPRDRKRRLKYFDCALELIRNSKEPPVSIRQQDKSELFYRFLGKVDNSYFIVQIKEDLNRHQKFFMSVFEYLKK